MQPDDFQQPFDGDVQTESSARDERILAVADHGVDPSPMKPTAFGSPETAAAVSVARDANHAHRNGRKSDDADDSAFTWRDALIWCGIPVLVIALINIFLIGAYVIPSGSMLNTIEIKDRVVASKLTPKYFDLKRGDIVVFHDPGDWLSDDQKNGNDDYLIKRVIGLPGDVVECAGPGQPVTINGVAVDETSYIRPGVDPSAFAFRVEVTANHIFVMGDNRANSSDSRYHQDDDQHGLVPVDNVVGVAVARFWPLNRIGLLDAHHDVFDDVPAGVIAQ